MEDRFFNIAIIVLILIGLIAVGTIIYNIDKQNSLCFDITVSFADGDTEEYHCTYYTVDNDSYLLYFHDGCKLDILKSNVVNIYFKEVNDSEN